MNYLYGANVQGIQSFIFETNKLTEIAGASELVEQICKSIFLEIANIKDGDVNLITNAAGTIKYLFESDADCKRLVRIFPKEIMKLAPGITLSQAVIKIEGDNPTPGDFSKLEKKLRVQRNRPVAEHGLGLMITERSRKTGKPGVDDKRGIVVDKGQVSKEDYKDHSKHNLLRKLVGTDLKISDKNYPHDISNIVKGEKDNWIAIVHADGNNLGKMIMQMNKDLQEHLAEDKTKDAFKEFSALIEKSTSDAVKRAFAEVALKDEDYSESYLPARPVVIGGDDVTLIIRGDLALSFTEKYLLYFEEETEKNFENFSAEFNTKAFDKGLTACAGIAYVKTNYPFHYGVNLCEELCKYSKRIAKDIAKNKKYATTPSCLTFHKVHSSFTESYKDIINEEMTAKEVQFNFGPYFLRDFEIQGYYTIEELKNQIRKVSRKNAPKAPLRNWLSDLKTDKARADQTLERIMDLNPHYTKQLDLSKNGMERIVNYKTKETRDFTHIHDLLSIQKIEKS